jgi:hypothetical protein
MRKEASTMMLTGIWARTASLLIVCFGLGLAPIGCGSDSLREYHVVERSSAQSASIPVTIQPVDAHEIGGAAGAIGSKGSAGIGDADWNGTGIAAEAAAPVSALEIANPRRVEVLIPHKSFLTDRKTGVLRLTFEDLNLLKVLNMDPVTPDAVSWMPEWMTALNARRIRIRGFMNPPYMAEDLERFVLLRDNMECCYGPGAKIYDCIEIHMKSGTTTDYIPLSQPFDVVGRLKIDLQSTGSSIYGLYVIEDAAVLTR